MKNIDVLKELAHKEKKVYDLIRFLDNRTEDSSMYSLLLGAGCSITSEINPASKLIEQWKEEITSSIEEVNNIGIDKYLESQRWYDKQNAYSSLFEKQYDQQTQRRAFIEKQVSNKIPSIGYAYLIKLIEKKYFNTIFTTNFDDLINEAFYRFSTERPIVCAHDSAISSVTVTSKRPKIIKLHGDYLFENIKNTSRETESLDINMRNKFIEFAKDYGLIVIGYSGNDRSIMDILSLLIKHDEYFKNGIYWCIREGETELSDELINLLWKERVYFVQIDGFDELMAQLNHFLNNNALPIDDAFLSSSRQQDLIESLAKNHQLEETKSDYIKADIVKLKGMIKDNLVSDFFNFMTEEVDRKNGEDNKNYKDIPSRIDNLIVSVQNCHIV